MKLSNKGPWKVTSQKLGDTMKYAVVRIINLSEKPVNWHLEDKDVWCCYLLWKRG